MARKRRAWESLGKIICVAGAVLTMIASFILAGESYYPGRFYIERQALWDNGTYGVKLTFLLTWFTLFAVVLIPVLIVAGIVALARRLTVSPTPAPPGWDLQQTRHRVKMALVGLVLLPTWLALTGIVFLAPEWLSPLGGFASVFLLLLPTLPMLGPALLFEALIPPNYVEGAIERLHYVTRKNRTTAYFQVAGRSYATNPATVQGFGEGTRIGLLATGFLKTVRRVARLG